MMFATYEVTSIYINIKGIFLSFFRFVNDGDFHNSEINIEKINSIIDNNKKIDNKLKDNNNILNDLFILEKYTSFCSSYLTLWKLIKREDFSSSWSVLQDCIDLLRIIKKFSQKNDEAKHLEFFEEQLINLEKLYPYTFFFSIGAVTDYYECSICGKNIDSFDCEHIKGELYGGAMATAIAKNIAGLDHVSIVKHPADKRCVMQIDNGNEQFSLIRYLSNLLSTGKIKPFGFKKLNFTTKKVNNPGHKAHGRNKPCICGSNKKFKNCCIHLEAIEIPHVDIIGNSNSVETSLMYTKDQDFILSNEIRSLLRQKT